MKKEKIDKKEEKDRKCKNHEENTCDCNEKDCNCEGVCQCGENCNCGDDCHCNEEHKCNDNCTCGEHHEENEIKFDAENDLNIAIIKNNTDLLLNENCCTCINIMLSNDGRILTSFLGCHNPYIVNQLEKAQKLYFKGLKKALKSHYYSDEGDHYSCDCGCDDECKCHESCNCGDDCHCDEDHKCTDVCNCNKDDDLKNA